jgi:hypothetical protein
MKPSEIVSLIIGLIGVVFFLFVLVSNIIGTIALKKNFNMSNVLVFGKIGRGKDLLFQYVIWKRKKPYYSNLDYGFKYNHCDLKDVSVAPNTFDNLINGDVTKIKPAFNEMQDFYFSDLGVYLPSQADSLLSKKYPSFPIFYALSRHLYNSHIHGNVQNLNRVWLKIREQADCYIKVKGNLKLPFHIVVFFRIYDRYQSALDDVAPLHHANKYGRAYADTYNAEHGSIKDYFVLVPKKILKYDSRYFKKIFLIDSSCQ